jgi:XRE family transcriptional regulator, aerobic/anaerobic benzoate catabolism transcriptional regulator
MNRMSKKEILDIDAFLLHLGERVRTMRTRRGMSRKALGKHSDVSERYLAQLEVGSGNCSIVLLRRIANALGVPIRELIDDQPDQSVERELLLQLIDQLPPEQVTAAREFILTRFRGKQDELRRDRIALIGLRGGGKSTLGKLLAEKLEVPFLDLDRLIEQQCGMKLNEIFEMFGQATFRRMERSAFEMTLDKYPRFVLATGGGLVTEPGTFELLLSSCFAVWVQAKPHEHMDRVIAQGDLRPMADNAAAMDDLLAILQSREALYSRADISLNTSGQTPRQSLSSLLRLLDRKAPRERVRADAR